MKTAMQQAIKEIAELWSSPSDQPTYTQIFNILESKLPIEKQQIIDSWENGYEHASGVNIDKDKYHGSQYYNETFKTK